MEYVLQKKQEMVWQDKLYNTPQARQELVAKALDATVKKDEEAPYLRPLFDKWALERKRLRERVAHAVEVGVSGNPIDVVPFVWYPAKKYDPVTKQWQFPAKDPVWGRMLDQTVTYQQVIYVPFFYDILQPSIDMSSVPFVANAVRPTITEISLFDYRNHNLHQLMNDFKSRVDDYAKNKEIDAWVKQQAWHKMIGMLLEKWPVLNDRKAAFERIAPDAVDELVGRVQCKGDSIGQAFLTVVEPLVGRDLLKDKSVDDDKALAKEPSDFPSGKVVRDFIEQYYGPSPASIEKKIEAVNQDTGYGRDLTVEEVQRIKDLVSKVGSLEFRILANSVDDKEAIEAAKSMLNNVETESSMKQELDEDQNSGLPPPAPRTANKEPKVFTIKLRGGDSQVTYSWVELGPQERQDLGLNNNALAEGNRGQAWSYLNTYRRKAVQIPMFGVDSEGRKVLQGALFYSRECQDRNMPEEERRRKKYEYFVLTRNPEIVDGKETSKIDGKYLVVRP